MLNDLPRHGPPGLDWATINARVGGFPRLAAVIHQDVTKGRRIGTYPVIISWLHQWTDKCQRMLQSVESDLDLIAASGVSGYPQVSERLARADRQGAFATLAEVFVGAWYLRSGHKVHGINTDHHQGDVVIVDGEGTAHVEVMNLMGSRDALSWADAWGGLYTQLQLLGLPCFISFSSGPASDFRSTDAERFPVRTALPIPTWSDIDAIVNMVLQNQNTPRETAPEHPDLAPRLRIERFSEKWPDAWFELVDPSAGFPAGSVMGSHDGVGTLSAADLRDRILSKKAPTVDGRKVLIVEVSHYPGITFTDSQDIEALRTIISKAVRSWDAVVAYARQWDGAEAAAAWVLFCREDAVGLIPALPPGLQMA